MQEIVCIYKGPIAQKDAWRVIECEVTESADERFPAGSRVKVTCDDEHDELSQFLSYRFYGHFAERKGYGLQFAAKTFLRAQPHGRAGVIQYLQQAPWVGLQTAGKLWAKFGADAVRLLREKPTVAASACGGSLTPDRAEEAAAWLKEEQQLEGCSIDLMELLSNRGFPKKTTKKCMQAWGNRAAEVIQELPYQLMRFRGCGFKKTDKMYLELGLPPAAILRQAACAWHALASDTEGHTWRPAQVVEAHLRANIGGADVDAVKACRLAKRLGVVGVRRDSLGNVWLAEGRRANAERIVAERIADLTRHEGERAWPNAAELEGMSEHQRDELTKALAGWVGLLTGGPGTGKTYSLAALVKALPLGDVAICCPTGKAAERAGQVLESYGVYVKPRTIHSTLGVRKSDEGDGWGFDHCLTKPLPYRFVIVDESSMVDTALMGALLSACGRGTHVLFVGDPHQLPPVGSGAPLRDFIAAGLPCGKLTEIRRNSGAVVEVCAAIREGRPWRPSRSVDVAAGENLWHAECSTAAEQITRLERALDVARAEKYDPIWDVQIVCAVNVKGDLSRRTLNDLLQAKLNKCPHRPAGQTFALGDKVVNTKNGFFREYDLTVAKQPNDAPELFVANGELGKVVLVESSKMVVAVGRKTVLVPLGRAKASEGDDDDSDEEKTNTGCTWDLGYALSCHKSQGSEWPIVVVMVDEYPGARRVCSREWIYTAISRAKKLCVLIGKKSTADRFCRREVLPFRKTFLVEQIAEQVELLGAVNRVAKMEPIEKEQ